MPKAKTQTPTTALPAEAQAPKGKLGAILALLQQPTGATLADMQAATGWQAHSVRGALAGAINKKGFEVASEKTESGRVYRASKGAGA